MKGFDPKWRDLPHFILGITEENAEKREFGSLRHRYRPGLVVRSPASVVIDNTNVIAALMATFAEFPDRQALGEDVIWSEDRDGATATSDAYLSSHRLMCTATHTRPGLYGAPTGRKVAYRIIADCACRDDGIYDEWLVRDQATIITQLGFDVIDWTRALITREGGPSHCVRPLTQENDVPGVYTGRGNDNEWGARYAEVLTRIMAADFDVIPKHYDRAAVLHYPRGQDGVGWGDADQFWMGLRAAFPHAQFRIHHVIGRDDPMMPPRAAVRWSLDGTHSGWGRFGTPTGAPVHVMGICHAEFGPFGPGGSPAIRREFALIDETAIWKQILLHTGAHE